MFLGGVFRRRINIWYSSSIFKFLEVSIVFYIVVEAVYIPITSEWEFYVLSNTCFLTL